VGFLTDILGRKKLFIIALLSFIVFSLLPVFFPYISILFFARLFQGLALGGYAVITRGIFSDILSPEHLPKTITLIATAWGIGPIIGPAIGGYLQYYFNWQACFIFFAVYGLCGLLIFLFILPETLQQKQTLQLTQLKNNFIAIARHRVFIGVIVLMGSAYSMLIAFNTLGPFLIQNSLGYSAIDFGHIALGLGVSFLLGTIVCRILIKKYPPETLFLFTIPIILIIIILSLVLAYLNSKNLCLVIISSLFTFFTCGILYPAGMSKGISLFRHLPGSSTALMGLINVLITSLVATLLGFVNSTSVAMSWTYLLLMLITTGCYLFLIR